MKGLIFVVSGPSGVGKDTVIEQAVKGDQNIGVTVSHTTRHPREGERDGVHYHFVSKEEFMAMISQGEFAEWAEVCGNYYGTSRVEVEKVSLSGCDILLNVDTQGGLSVKKAYQEAYLLFILPPSRYDLEHRLERRSGGEGPEVLARRMRKADTELAEAAQYDGWLVNRELEETVRFVKDLISALRKGKKPHWKLYRHPFVLETAQKEFWRTT